MQVLNWKDRDLDCAWRGVNYVVQKTEARFKTSSEVLKTG